MTTSRGPACYVRTDGSCLGNPGPVSWAYTVILRHGEKGRGWNTRVEGSGKGLPDGNANGTNNEAEYAAVYNAVLRLIHEEHIAPRLIHVFTDSMLVANQLSGTWKIHEPRMEDMVRRIHGMAQCEILASWVPREFLWREDAAAREAHNDDR